MRKTAYGISRLGKAFDEILHSKLFLALERLDVPEKVIKVLKDAYSNPKFYVKDNFGESKEKAQKQELDKVVLYHHIFSY